jgi:hypothetical protein
MSGTSSNSSKPAPASDQNTSDDILTAVLEVLERQIAWEQKQDEFVSQQKQLLNRLTHQGKSGTDPDSQDSDSSESSSVDSNSQYQLAELLQKTRLQRKAIAAEFKAERARLQRAWEELRAQQKARQNNAETPNPVPESQVVADVDVSKFEERLEEFKQQIQQRVDSLQSALSHAHRQQSNAEDQLNELTQYFREIASRVDSLESSNIELRQSNEELRLTVSQIGKNTQKPKDSKPSESDLWETQKKALLIQYGDHSSGATKAAQASQSATPQPDPQAAADDDNSTRAARAEQEFVINDEMISEMRQKWSEKLRAAEIELSIERANIARERNALEERISHMERQMAAKQRELKKLEPETQKKRTWKWFSIGKSKQQKQIEKFAGNSQDSVAEPDQEIEQTSDKKPAE